MAKLPSPSSLLHGKQRRRPRGAGGGQSGRSGLRGWPWTGEKGRGGVRGTDPRPHLELGWRAEVARRERAAAVGEWLRRRRCGSRGEARVGGEVVWMVVELGGPFIAELRRWSGVGG